STHAISTAPAPSVRRALMVGEFSVPDSWRTQRLTTAQVSAEASEQSAPRGGSGSAIIGRGVPWQTTETAAALLARCRRRGPGARGRGLLQVGLEVGEGTLPRVLGRGLVVGLRPLVVEECMVHAGVDVDARGLPRLLDRRLYVAGGLRGHEGVLLREESQHGARELAVVGLHVGMDAVEVHHRA